jgi:gamma-glutamyl hercynylcysteine S-oxide hydrolase
MCRLFAYVHAGPALSMRETLGDRVLDEFQQMATVHRDGWGTVWAIRDGISAYLSSHPAIRDAAMFNALTTQSVDSAILHERWASPDIGLSVDNQQPFTFNSLAFAHNGTIGDDDGNIVNRPAPYRASLGLAHSTTMSDSRIYAELFCLRLGEVRSQGRSLENQPSVAEVRQALSLAIAQLRRDYPEASYNNVIQTADFTYATRAHADRPTYNAGLRRRYEEAGWAHRIDSYYEIMHATLSHADGSVSSVASSSGYQASDAWAKLGNNKLLAISHRDASVQMLPLDT